MLQILAFVAQAQELRGESEKARTLKEKNVVIEDPYYSMGMSGGMMGGMSGGMMGGGKGYTGKGRR